jgi:WD40 repeat protein
MRLTKKKLHDSNKLINENEHGLFNGHKWGTLIFGLNKTFFKQNLFSRKEVNCLAVSLDDSKLASGSEDCSIRIWDTITRQCIKILNHNGIVICASTVESFCLSKFNTNHFLGPVTNIDFKIGSYFFNEDKSPVVPIFNVSFK